MRGAIYVADGELTIPLGGAPKRDYEAFEKTKPAETLKSTRRMVNPFLALRAPSSQAHPLCPSIDADGECRW